MTPSSSCAPKSDERDKVETTSKGHFRSNLPTFRSPAIAAVAADTLGLAKHVHSGSLPRVHQSVPPAFSASTSTSSFVFLQHSTAVGLKLLVLFDSFHRSFSLQLLLKLLAFGSVDIVYDRLSLSASMWWIRVAFSGQIFSTYSCSWNILPVVYPIIPPPIAAKRPSLRPASGLTFHFQAVSAKKNYELHPRKGCCVLPASIRPEKYLISNYQSIINLTKAALKGLS